MAVSDPQTPTEFQTWALTSLTCWAEEEVLQFTHIFHIIAASDNRDPHVQISYQIGLHFRDQIFRLISFFYITFCLSDLMYSTATGNPLLNKKLKDTSEDKYELTFASGSITVKESVPTAKECLSVVSTLPF